MAKEYYFISDLHIGGDGALDPCEFETEMITFLRRLEEKDRDTELVIAGDFLGLWEFTTLNGVDKLHAIIASHFELFRQFQCTGSKIHITVIPGNHDHELATDPEFGTILQLYNIQLEAKEHITRTLAGKSIWIEHGHQHDDYNRFEI
ncbi:MAG: metallophosphoesterase, partial [Candidatus Hydrogenedentes bacterium]|nr:metallophosphoesterase [Candidatus Hydrogenedentota bacterium]